MQIIAIQQRIHEIRGQKVMLDFDLADLYGVQTKVLNQAVKRNRGRFPSDFMFKLKEKEWQSLKSQFVNSSTGSNPMRSQFVTASQKKRNIGTTPFAFTEHGVTMLASVLRSDRAIKMNIAIVRAFVALKQFALDYKDLAEQIQGIRQTVSDHSEQLNQIYDAIENMLEVKEEKKSWEERVRIGFRAGTENKR